MGLTYVKVRVGNPANGYRPQEVNCLVDSGIIYSSAPILSKLHIKPHSTREFVLANDSPYYLSAIGISAMASGRKCRSSLM